MYKLLIIELTHAIDSNHLFFLLSTHTPLSDPFQSAGKCFRVLWGDRRGGGKGRSICSGSNELRIVCHRFMTATRVPVHGFIVKL